MRPPRLRRALLSGLWFMGCAAFTACGILSASTIGADPVAMTAGVSLGAALWGAFLGPRVFDHGHGWRRFGISGIVIALSSLPTGLAFFCILGSIHMLDASVPRHWPWYEVVVGTAWMFVMSCLYSVLAMIADWWFLPALCFSGFGAGMLLPVVVGIVEAALDPNASESGTP